MNNFLHYARPTIVISPVTKESVGSAFGTTGWTTANWPTTNKAIFIPFTLHQTIVVKMLFTFNGNPVSGNMDIGIYDFGRALRVHTGARAQAGINQPQGFRIPDTELTPGSYWLTMAMDNSTGNVFRRAAGIGDQAAAYGVTQCTNNFPLQDSVDGLLTRLSTATIPFIALSTRDFI